MPILNVTNNTQSDSGLSDPQTLFFKKVAPGANAFDIAQETLDNLEGQLEELAARVDGNGNPKFLIDVSVSPTDGANEFGGAATLAHYLANKVNVNTVVANPTTPSTVSARRVNIAAGEAMIDGKLFIDAGANDVVGDAEVDKAGADVSAVNLTAAKDSYTHVVLVNNAGVREVVLVRGDEYNAGLAVKLTKEQIATAVGVYLGAAGPVYEFVEIAEVLFEEAAGLTQTTTSLRPAPPSYA